MQVNVQVKYNFITALKTSKELELKITSPDKQESNYKNFEAKPTPEVGSREHDSTLNAGGGSCDMPIV